MFSLKSFRPANLSVSGTVHNWLLLSAAFSCALLLARVIVTDSIMYVFLTWNLFLAFIPYFITWWMTKDVRLVENRVRYYMAFAVWLLFIPNSFYIITDLFHLNRSRSAPQWFDLLLIFSFAWNGLLAGVLSLRRVEVLLAADKGNLFAAVFVFLVMWLCGFGIYIGRYLRFNSWDVVTNPLSLVAEILDLVIHPLQNAEAWAMTGCYALFMTLLYFTLKKMSENFSPNP